MRVVKPFCLCAAAVVLLAVGQPSVSATPKRSCAKLLKPSEVRSATGETVQVKRSVGEDGSGRKLTFCTYSHGSEEVVDLYFAPASNEDELSSSDDVVEETEIAGLAATISDKESHRTLAVITRHYLIGIQGAQPPEVLKKLGEKLIPRLQ